MQMDEGLDTGPVYAKAELQQDGRVDAGQLTEQLTDMGVALLAAHLGDIIQGVLFSKAQSSAGASYAHKMTKAMAVIDWAGAASVIVCQVRAYCPWPVAVTTWQGQKLRVWQAQLPPEAVSCSAAAGTLVGIGLDYLDVCCGDGMVVRLLQLQREGSTVQSARDFINARGALLELGVTQFGR